MTVKVATGAALARGAQLVASPYEPTPATVEELAERHESLV